MDYNTTMAIIFVCLFAMGCLCCIWIICCAIALKETKFAPSINDFPFPFNDVASESSPATFFKEQYAAKTFQMQIPMNE